MPERVEARSAGYQKETFHINKKHLEIVNVNISLFSFYNIVFLSQYFQKNLS